MKGGCDAPNIADSGQRLPDVGGIPGRGGRPANSQSQPPEDKKDKPEKEKESADEKYLRTSGKLVSGIELEIYKDETWSKVKRIEKPLLLYGDPTRDNDRGSVWGWSDKGRPVATLELWQHVSDRTRWYFCICNTSGGRLRANLDGQPWWRSNDSAVELKDVPGAPVPAAETAQRQLQMKLLAKKFTGHEFWDPNNSRYELRRLERPLYTYKDVEGGVLDGGLYTLANGTNPEIMLFLEARVDPNDDTKTAWQFVVGRSAHAELHLEYDGKEVYEAPRGYRVSGRTLPYWLSDIDAAPDDK